MNPDFFERIDCRYSPSLMFQSSAEYPFPREPVIQRMPDGSLLSFHYTGGPTEPHDLNNTTACRSTDDGATWSDPEVIFEHDTRAVWTPEIFVPGNGEVLAFGTTFDASSHYCEIKTFVSKSKDSGKTWSEPVSLPGGVGGVIARKGFVLQDGTWLIPCYWQEQRGDWNWIKKEDGSAQFSPKWVFCCGVLRSTNEGRSFSLHGYLRPEDLSGTPQFEGWGGLWEPNAVEVAPNHIVMLMRAENVGRKVRAESFDGGITWTSVEISDIPDPNSKVSLLQRRDLTIMLHNPDPTPGWFNRRTISLWCSKDGAKTWPTKLDLATVRENVQCALCYPHGYLDEEKHMLYVACDTAVEHFLLKVPFRDFL